MEEENLSQKLNRLSMSVTHEEDTRMTIMMMMMSNIKDDIAKIPYYLTKENKSSQGIIRQVFSSTNIVPTSKSTNNMNELRKIALLIYKIRIIQIYQFLWTSYLKSGLGQLISPSERKQQQQPLVYSTASPIWPKEIKTIVLANSSMDRTNENESCLKFVNHQLNELEYRLKECQGEFNVKINHFPGYTISIEKTFETYIEQHPYRLRMEIGHQIELLQYDYHIRALKLEYLRHQLNEYQVCMSSKIDR